MSRPLVWLFCLLSVLVSNSPVELAAALPSPTPAEQQFATIAGVRNFGPVMQIPMPANMTFEDAQDLLESGAGGENLNIAGRNSIGKAIGIRTHKPFPAYTVYHLCNLTVGEKIISLDPRFGPFMPCKVVLYEDKKPGGRVWALAYRNGWALQYFPDFPTAAANAVMDINDRIFNILFEMAIDE